MTTAAEFMTIPELAVADGYTPDAAEYYIDEMVNHHEGLLKPYAEHDGAFTRISRSDLINRYCYDLRWNVRVLRSDAEAYIEARQLDEALEAEAARFTTSDRLTWANPEDRDLEAHGHPVFAADGSPALHRFRTAAHVASWLTAGGSLAEDLDADLNTHLLNLISKDSK